MDAVAARQSNESQSIDWCAEGEARDVEVAGVRVTARFVGHKGRRARIAITGPAGAVFRALDRASHSVADFRLYCLEKLEALLNASHPWGRLDAPVLS